MPKSHLQGAALTSSAVRPLPSAACTSAPSASSCCTIAACPAAAAVCRGSAPPPTTSATLSAIRLGSATAAAATASASPAAAAATNCCAACWRTPSVAHSSDRSPAHAHAAGTLSLRHARGLLDTTAPCQHSCASPPYACMHACTCMHAQACMQGAHCSIASPPSTPRPKHPLPRHITPTLQAAPCQLLRHLIAAVGQVGLLRQLPQHKCLRRLLLAEQPAGGAGGGRHGWRVWL